MITHAMLVAASGARDVEKSPLHFAIVSLQSGRLEKLVDGRWVALRPGGWPAPAIGPGERIRWIPSARAGGTTPAFTIRVSDGSLSPAMLSRVSIDVTG
ncbi:MAG: hypothetical protein ACKOC4_10155 [Planctomycetia bacterium]